MNTVARPKIVVLGFLSHFPVAGVAWQTLHYLIGFRRLGFEVYYVEAHGCSPSKLMESETDDGPVRAATYIAAILSRFGFEDCWAYHALYEGRHFGLSSTQLGELYRSAALIVNLHGSHLPRPELAGTGRLVYLETDPVDVEIDLFHQSPATLDYLTPHCAFFTFGENLGKPDCLVPAPTGFKFVPTRQPVVLDLWENSSAGDAESFTTIGNWKQPWRQITFKGEVYHWSKHFEFEKFITLPRRVAQSFELALSSYDQADRQLLESHGWRVRHALNFSRDLDLYRDYVAGSRGEFTVAKDQNIRLRSGWFSDRAVTYLAAGRPVVTQETGFSNILPTGKGLLAFSTLEESVAAIEAVNSDYQSHSRAAQHLAREFFSHDVVLGRLLAELGVSCPKKEAGRFQSTGERDLLSSNREDEPAAFEVPEAVPCLPEDLIIQPVSRWPTRLEEATFQTGLSLSIPSLQIANAEHTDVVSVVMPVRNGLAYTKMCLASLFEAGWPAQDELIIVDNASTDGTAEYLTELSRRFPFVRILTNVTNIGFAAANNQALQAASGAILILLNNDTLVAPAWRDRLVGWLKNNPGIGMVGPVTNRTCNEAQVDAPYRTYKEFKQFATDYTLAHSGEANEIPMLAMFCAAMRRDLFQRVGPLDEGFEIGMFEDDDYAQRMRAAGYRLVCAEDVFIHHFGQGSLGELCSNGEYDAVLETNRRRFEEKWGREWKAHGRRLTPEYARLRERIRKTAAGLPAEATVVVVSKGDSELLKLNGHRAWHFPQDQDGQYANIYPAEAAGAVAQLQSLRKKGADYLLIPKPAFWWLSYYAGFRDYLERECRLAVKDEETCVIYHLGGAHE